MTKGELLKILQDSPFPDDMQIMLWDRGKISSLCSVIQINPANLSFYDGLAGDVILLAEVEWEFAELLAELP